MATTFVPSTAISARHRGLASAFLLLKSEACRRAAPHRTGPGRRMSRLSRGNLVRTSPVNATHREHEAGDGEDGYIWRQQNAYLLDEAQRHGVDAAVKLLWELNGDGKAQPQNFNQVVNLLASKGRFEDALDLAEETGNRGMANNITFRPLMKRCCAQGDSRGAKRVYKALSRLGIECDMFMFAELLGAFVRAQDMASAERVIPALRESGRRPHVVLYNTLLKGYARLASVRRGFEVLEEMDENDVKPDETTFNTLLNICVRAKDPDSLHNAIALMQKHNVKPGAPTFNTMLKMYSRTANFEGTMEIFRQLQETVEPSIVTFNTLIDGCAHRGDMHQASIFFEDMLERGMSPDICTLTSLLKGFGRSNDSLKAVQLYNAMKEGGFRVEERTRYAVINACLWDGDRENALKVIDEISRTGGKVRAKTWKWLLESDILAGDEERAIETLRLMYLNGALLDTGSKVALIREAREQGDFLRLQRKLKAVKISDGS